MSDCQNPVEETPFCAAPIVRRAYLSLVAWLAVFIATIVVLREPFRGYLAEVRLSGPATEGLNLADVAPWLKQAEARAAIVTLPAGDKSPRAQIRITFLAPRPTPATARLDELAARWLYQYLPQRLTAFRHAELAGLRQSLAEFRSREDAAQVDVEALRQRQFAMLIPASAAPVNEITPALPAVVATVPANQSDSVAWRQQLEAMHLAMARLQSRFTDEHPEVIALRSQIERLEQLLGNGHNLEPTQGPELIQAPAGDRQAVSPGLVRPAAASGRLAGLSGNRGDSGAADRSGSELGGEVTKALSRLNLVTRQRQEAEQRLSDRMQEIASQPTAAEWSAERAHVVTRLGGTPRCSTLALAGLLATIGGAIMFRGSAVVVQPTRIESVRELASALELPVIGNASGLRKATARLRLRLFTAGRVRVLGHLGEGVVGLAIAACLLSILIEPSLVRQVVADPFGTLSEVMGRMGI